MSKIAFKKKTPLVTVKKSNPKTVKQQAKAHQMRLVCDSTGMLLDVNDAFAATLGIPNLDLINRNLLDTVLFKNFDDLIDDRALFNNLSHGDNIGLSNLRSGEHVLLLGKSHEPHAFHFDWVRAHTGMKYLVAASVQGDEKPEWDSVLKGLGKSSKTTPQNNKKQSVPLKDTMAQALDIKAKDYVHKTIENNDVTKADSDIFTDINRNVQCVLAHDGTILRTNDVLVEKIGTIDSLSFLDIIHDEDRAIVRQYLQSLHDDDNIAEDIKFEVQMNTSHANPIWMHWRVRAHDDAFYCVGYDITDSKQIELSLKKQEQELSAAQALANMGNWRWQVGSDRLEWSDQIYKIFGVTDTDFTPTLDNTNALIHKRDIGHMMQAFQRAIIEQNDYDIDFRVIRDDKSVRYVRCEGRCELDADGDVIALYGVMQDVSEHAEHEMELRAAKDAAEQAYASKSRFLANMSHELRTPLNAIIGFSDMINRQMLGAIGNEKYLDYAENIKDSGEHLLSLITDILDMSKIEAGKYDLDLEKIQLGDVLKTALRMIESRAQDGNITLNNTVQNNDPIIIADRRAVMQILLNILSNAVKFTNEGGEITMGIEEFDNHVTVKITDNGIGIPANKLSAVLRPFEQVATEHTRNHEGSGLGLAITKELVEMHGGTLSLESTINEGTIASIRLPRDASIKN